MSERILVLYVFHIYNERVQHFFDNAIFYDENVDFIVIANDKDIELKLPEYVMTFHRDNIGYDFGGWSDALITKCLYDKYKYFIFVNSSVLGPYLHNNYMGKWTDIYINGLNKNNIRLFGSTINNCHDTLKYAHIQSYIFSMKKETLFYLMGCKIFSIKYYAETFDDAIWKKEVLMSRLIIDNNWNIGCTHRYYDGVDFTFKNKKPEEYKIKFLNDIMFPCFENFLWQKEELIFTKGNRDKSHPPVIYKPLSKRKDEETEVSKDIK